MTAGIPPADVLACLHELGESQHGLVTWTQLRALGLSPAAISRLAAKGFLFHIRPRVYRLLGTAETRQQAITAARLWAGRDSIASHRTGAELHGLPGGDPSVTEIIAFNSVRTFDLVVHFRLQILPGDETTVDGIPVTSIERTLVDLGSVVRRGTLARALDSALLRPGITLQAISDRLERTARRGRNGTTVLRGLIMERAGENAPLESPLERDFLRLVRRCGLEEPIAQFPVVVEGRTIARLDFAYPELKIGIELDGFAHHSSREAFERDRHRLTELTNEGWHMLVFTQRQVRGRPNLVEQAIVRARRTRAEAFFGS